jgi:hypothetical protein
MPAEGNRAATASNIQAQSRSDSQCAGSTVQDTAIGVMQAAKKLDVLELAHMSVRK